MTFEETLILTTKIGGAIGAVALVLLNVKKLFNFFYRLIKIPASITSIEHELKPNNGSSIKDSIKRIEERQIIQEQRILFLLDSNPEIGIFEADKDGNCTRTNTTYCRMLGKSSEECLGYRWTSSLHEEDKEKVIQEWDCSMKYERPFDLKYRFLKTNGESFEVHGRAHPIFNTENKIIAWFGSIRLLF